MRFEGTELIQTPPAKVWAFLTDPDAVCRCVPGFRSLEMITPERFRALASITMGTLQVDFNITVDYDLLNEPALANFRAVATATGGNGEARVMSHLVLTEKENDSTELSWLVNMTVVGLIAGLAERLGSSLAKYLTTEFFNCVKLKLQAPPGGSAG